MSPLRQLCLRRERIVTSHGHSFYFCISGQFCSFCICVISLIIFLLCQFLWISPPPFIYFILALQVYVTVSLLQAIWSHWFIKCSVASAVFCLFKVWVSLSNSGWLSNLIWSVLKVLGNIRPISGPMELHIISLPYFLPCQKSMYNKDE